MGNIFIGGATGSGKSVFMSSFILSITKQLSSNKLDLILFDPKHIEFLELRDKGYTVITNYTEAIDFCKGLVKETERRYSLFSIYNVKNIYEYNGIEQRNKLKHIVIVFDEIADFVCNDSAIYDSLLKVMQKGGKSGIHIIVATQWPRLLQLNKTTKNKISHIEKDFLNSFKTNINFRFYLNDNKLSALFKEEVKLKSYGEAIAIIPSKKYKVLTPFISNLEFVENIRRNDLSQ